MDEAMLVLRLVVGLTLAAHGAQKLFGWFQGPGFSGTAGFYDSLGFHPGKALAALSVMAEFGGGLLIAFGLLTPLGAAGVIGSMAAAIATFHWANGFFSNKGGYEFNLLIAATAFAIAAAGPGGASVDAVMGWDLAGIGWGLAALVVGLATAAIVMARRTARPEVEEAQAPADKELAQAA